MQRKLFVLEDFIYLAGERREEKEGWSIMTRTMCEVCLYPGGPRGALKADNGDIENDKYQAGHCICGDTVTGPPGESGEWARVRGGKGGGGCWG